MKRTFPIAVVFAVCISILVHAGLPHCHHDRITLVSEYGVVGEECCHHGTPCGDSGHKEHNDGCFASGSFLTDVRHHYLDFKFHCHCHSHHCGCAGCHIHGCECHFSGARLSFSPECPFSVKSDVVLGQTGLRAPPVMSA